MRRRTPCRFGFSRAVHNPGQENRYKQISTRNSPIAPISHAGCCHKVRSSRAELSRCGTCLATGTGANRATRSQAHAARAIGGERGVVSWQDAVIADSMPHDVSLSSDHRLAH